MHTGICPTLTTHHFCRVKKFDAEANISNLCPSRPPAPSAGARGGRGRRPARAAATWGSTSYRRCRRSPQYAAAGASGTRPPRQRQLRRGICCPPGRAPAPAACRWRRPARGGTGGAGRTPPRRRSHRGSTSPNPSPNLLPSAAGGRRRRRRQGVSEDSEIVWQLTRRGQNSQTVFHVSP